MAKEIFHQMVENGRSAAEIIGERGLAQITDEKYVNRIVEEVLRENPESVRRYREGEEKLLGFFVGQVMKKTEGKANPQLVNEAFKAKLSQHKSS
jgi:aspartyl-tRNA(Asn)/glutamyl-tRNA(Gln) amidotransferase subunit B